MADRFISNKLFAYRARHAGAVALDGARIVGPSSYEVARAGLGLVPEGRRILPNLAGASASAGPWTLERSFGSRMLPAFRR